MKPLFIVTLAALASCGRHVDKAFDPYLDRFLDDAKARGCVLEPDAVTIVFTEDDELLSRGVTAQCDRDNLVVTLNKTAWEQGSDVDREYRFYHELGHCLLGRYTHTNGDNEQLGIPLSMMGSSSIRTEIYVEHREYYLDELFSGSVTCGGAK